MTPPCRVPGKRTGGGIHKTLIFRLTCGPAGWKYNALIACAKAVFSSNGDMPETRRRASVESRVDLGLRGFGFFGDSFKKFGDRRQIMN